MFPMPLPTGRLLEKRLGPFAMDSGTTKLVTGLPPRTELLFVTFKGLSTNGTSDYEIKLGTPAGIEEDVYSGFVFRGQAAGVAGENMPVDAAQLTTSPAAAQTYNGLVMFVLHDPATNSWVGQGGLTTSGQTNIGVFEKTLDDALDRFQFGTASGDTLDAGTMSAIAFHRVDP